MSPLITDVKNFKTSSTCAIFFDSFLATSFLISFSSFLRFSCPIACAVFLLYPALIADCVALDVLRYSCINFFCFSVNLRLTGFFFLLAAVFGFFLLSFLFDCVFFTVAVAIFFLSSAINITHPLLLNKKMPLLL